ncbi:hypothetical protein TNCV_1495151 [Trichonephila clavipes]|nr:hypothetical protein TNCV_1495151 [Trichonephila clavipes]
MTRAIIFLEISVAPIDEDALLPRPPIRTRCSIKAHQRQSPNTVAWDGKFPNDVQLQLQRRMNGVHLALRHEGQKANRIVMTSKRNGELSSREGVVQKFRFRFLQLSSGGFLNLH